MEDCQIIELYWQRLEQAVTETADKYGKRLGSLSQNILHNAEDAEECVNDTYHAAWKTIPPKRPEYFFAYLAKITRHFLFDRLDRRNAKKRSALIVELSEELENCIPAPDDYERRMESEEIGAVLSSFLRGQSEEVRKVFVRRYWYLDPIREIALQYGMSEGKVKSMLFRTRKALRTYLEREDIVL